uniref:TRAF-type zinc finger domain-containing protein 1 n=1 Tax=Pogona vitticeps TaxID=103695 RepID=A0ABM5F1U6_9SAUR
MMAAVAEEGCETQLCSNCKKEIPVANFTIHEIHCSRNIGVCPVCKESFPKSEMRNHREQEHTPVFCKCGMKMDKGCLQEHEAAECPLRTVACQHCDIELAFNKLQDHEDYCGSRTERCPRCSHHVLVRDLKTHPEDCGEKAEEARVAETKPRLNSEVDLQNIETIRRFFHPEDPVGFLPKRDPFPEGRLYNCLAGDRLPREFSRRNIVPSWPDRNRAPLEKTATPSPFGGDLDCHLDYLLALSLQQEIRSREERAAEASGDFWKSLYPTETRTSSDRCVEADDASVFSRDVLASGTPPKPTHETRLPCEFCEELYSEEDLILHQTGCNPSSALASFSKRGSVASQSERFRDLWEQFQSGRPSGAMEAFPLRAEAPGSLMLPCEFCGVQLEEEILFHHQDQCDLRPATAPSRGRDLLQPGTLGPAEIPEKTDSTDLPQRRRRHQGEISPQYLEEFRRPKPPPPAEGSPPRVGSLGAARVTQPASLGGDSRRENNAGPSVAGKAKNLGARIPSRGPRGPPPVAAAPRRSSQPGYRPSFPGTAPLRPGPRSERSHSPARAARHNLPKAKPWLAEADSPDDE